ncbi:MAG: hypothetical protein ACI9RL_001556 [Candidatus Paceibacteria bacterium]|jgi:hypothetical protein
MNIMVAIIFIVLGLLITYGKLYRLIAGYNTMSKEEQKKVDIQGIANVFRNGMFGMAALLLLGSALSLWLADDRIELYLFFISIAIGLPYILIVSNSNKYKINND